MDAISEAFDWVSRTVAIVTVVTVIWRFIRFRGRQRVIAKFFGSRAITICLPRRELSNRSAIVEADFVAAKTLELFLQSFKIRVDYSFVEPDGTIDLQAPGLVVICGPKSSNVVAKALNNDSAFSFQQQGEHWTIFDHTTKSTYYSRSDTKGQQSDIGLLSRAHVAAHSRKTFLSLAGVHAEGSAVMAEHLCDYRTLKRMMKRSRRHMFSAVIADTYNVDPLRVTSTQELVFRKRRQAVPTPPPLVDVDPPGENSYA
ncbi:hypothetical protein [Brevibacterium gallinarum]|uniref:Uncharacterized protein n=1 Tax=Brevibacterium gallinarum TaxID=2762220 RepID=A0ABR8WYV5_9MICO|nr:hypothetical protein [Brevibacterium gallinarum]MBD8021866.1 hypothetical protein [Brevibacterium gallinarum]